MSQPTNLKVEGPKVINSRLAFKVLSDNPIKVKSLEQIFKSLGRSFLDYCNTKFTIDVWGEKK